MILVIDVGNSNTVIGVYQHEKLLLRWRMRTEIRITKDELRSKLHALMLCDGLEHEAIELMVLATVVPDLAVTWQAVAKLLCSEKLIMVSGSEDYGLDFNYPKPEQVGADRIANALAARDIYHAPAIVVDFGTATNIDVIDRSGKYCGGTISPGVDISLRALFECAAKLSTVRLHAPEDVIGKSTEDALRSGILYGAAAQAEGLVARIKSSLKETDSKDCIVIATGGMAAFIAKFTSLFDVVDQDLTIEGLYLIAKRVRAKNKRC